MIERGKIRNRDFASTLRDFSGLKWGRITPTDIDAFLDFKNKAFVFIESKHKNGIPAFFNEEKRNGQKLALERLVDSVSVPAILIVAEHSGEFGSDIELGSNSVIKYRSKKLWLTPKKAISVRALIEAFLKRERLEIL